MPCEAYREALIEAAASGTQPPVALGAHLQACAGCRAALAREKFLFASMDAGLQTAANADVPSSLLLHVRAQLNHPQIVSHSLWLPAWTAIATAAALALLIVLIHNAKRGFLEQVSKESVVANIASSPELPSTVRHSEQAGHSTRNNRIRPVKTKPIASFEQVSVLVAPGQKQVIDALLTAMQQSKVKADVLFTEKPQQPLQGLQVSPLDIAPIEVKPLADVGGNSAAEREDTKL